MFIKASILCAALVAVSPQSTCDSQKSCSSKQGSTPASAVVEGKNIVETALASEDFSTLVKAVTAAGLAEALQAEGPLTVFAPTNAAFAKLPKETVAELFDPKNKAMLQAILTYHVAAGKLTSKEVVSRDATASLNGQRIQFKTTDDGVKISGATLLSADIECTNGVIHVIDTVILPSTLDIVETAMKAGSFKTLGTALKAAQLAEALKGKGPFTVFAPSDEAFAALPRGTVEDLLEPENREKLAAILKYHVVPGRVYTSDFSEKRGLKTLQGQALKAGSREGKTFMVQGAKIISADIDTTNGVIQVIDKVLLP